MAIDADPSTEAAIDTSASWNLGEEFDVSTDITAVGTHYFGYKLSMEFDDEILTFVRVGNMNIVYTDLGDMTFHMVTQDRDDDSDGRPEIYGEAARATGTTPATGQANFVRFRCTAAGTTSLHLLTSSESTDHHTSTVDFFIDPIPTLLQDATITCTSAEPSSTPTPTPTPTGGPAVGGIADLPSLGAVQTGPSSASTASPRPRAITCVTLGLAATGGVAVAVFAWYTRRRRLG
jgi:hypothetical protein